MELLEKIDWASFLAGLGKMILTAAFALIGAYYGLELRIAIIENNEVSRNKVDEQHSKGIEELNQRMLNLNKRMQKKIDQDANNATELLDKLDSRFVRRPLFNVHVEGIDQRLGWLNNDVQKLIDLQMGTGIYRERPEIYRHEKTPEIQQ